MSDTRPRRVRHRALSGGVAAAAVIVFALGVGTTTSASVGTTPATDAATATTDTPFTVPSRMEMDTGYVADGYDASDAFDNASNNQQDPNQWLQIWATPGATRSAGRWIALMTRPYGWYTVSPTAPGIERTIIAGHYAIERQTTHGVRLFTSAPDSDHSIDVESFGFTDEQLAQVLGGVVMQSGAAPVLVGADAALDGLDLIVSQPSQDFLGGPITPAEHYTMFRGIDASPGFDIRAGRQAPGDIVANRLLTPVPADLGSTVVAPDGTTMAGDRAVIVGQSAQGDASFYVQWHDGPTTVTVTGDDGFALDRLLAVAAATRQAWPGEWSSLLDTPQINSDEEYISPETDDYITVGHARTASQTDWTIGIAVLAANRPPAPGTIWVRVSTAEPAADGTISLSDLTSQSYFPLPPGQPVPALMTYRYIDATVLIATVDSAVEASTAVALRVTLPQLEPIVVPLVQIEGSTVSGAAYAFSQVGAYDAELIDATGAVVTSLAH